MAGDDTTPDPLFKNVPRRPRSAASVYTARPRKEEPHGKRSSSTVGDAENVPGVKKTHRLFPIPEPEGAKDHVHGGSALDRHGILGVAPPALSYKDKAAAAAAAASASDDWAEPGVDWAENERRRKGKTPVVNEDNVCAAVARRPPAGSELGKLMGDAIRSHGSTAVAGFKPSSGTKSKKPKEDRTKPKKPAKKDRTKPKTKPMKDSTTSWFWCGMGSDGMSSAGSDVDYSFDRIGVVSNRLRTTLRDFGVAPERVYGRLLSRCDRTIQQARLQMSCKRWRADNVEFPLYAFLTEEERMEAHGKGLALTAYDRGGDAYELTLRFYQKIRAYRLINNWSDFLRRNGLVVGKDEPAPRDDIMMDLWLFRPPGAKAGTVMLHYHRGDAAHADAALDEVERKKRLQLNNGDGGGNVGDGNEHDDDAVMEDVVGDADEKDDAGVMVEVAAAAPAPSSPSEPDSRGAIKAAEEQAGGPGKVPDDVPSSLPEPDGGVGAKAAEEQAGALGDIRASSDEVTAPSSLAADGMEEEQKAGSLMVMVLVEAATQLSLDSDAGGVANEVDNGAGAPGVVAAPAPPLSPESGGGAAMMAAEDEAAAAAAALVEAAAQFEAAQGLVMLSEANR